MRCSVGLDRAAGSARARNILIGGTRNVRSRYRGGRGWRWIFLPHQHGRRLTSHACPRPPGVQAIYRYPVEGARPSRCAEALSSPARRSRGTGAMRSRTGHRGSIRRRRALPKNPVPDADAERAVGRTAPPVMTTATHALTVRRGEGVVAGGWLRTTGRTRRDRDVFRGVLCRRVARAGEMLPAPGPFATARKVVAIINLATVAAIDAGNRRVGPPAALSRQHLCERVAGLGGVRPGRKGHRDRGTARFSSSSASIVAPRPRSIPTPESATWRFRATCRGLRHADCGIYAEGDRRRQDGRRRQPVLRRNRRRPVAAPRARAVFARHPPCGARRRPRQRSSGSAEHVAEERLVREPVSISTPNSGGPAKPPTPVPTA